MRGYSMPNLRESFFTLDSNRNSRSEGLDRYFLNTEEGLNDIDIVTDFDVNSITLGLKGDVASHQGGCCCGACAEGTSGQAGNGVTSAPDLVPGTIGSTASVAVGGSVNVSIDTLGDRDWYRVDLTAGVTYTIQTSSNGARLMRS